MGQKEIKVQNCSFEIFETTQCPVALGHSIRSSCEISVNSDNRKWSSVIDMTVVSEEARINFAVRPPMLDLMLLTLRVVGLRDTGKLYPLVTSCDR